MKKVLITGTSSGIGLASAKRFLQEDDYEVIGFDILPSKINHERYKHYICDVSDISQFPELGDIEYIVNNAGTVEEEKSISTNLMGYINIAEKYAFNPKIKSVLNIGSISGTDGLDTPLYCASQGGRISYTKNLMLRLSTKYKIPVNILCIGAAMTGLEPKLYEDEKLVNEVAEQNILRRWIMPEECADWVYFLTVVNKSMCGQVLTLDCGECSKRNWIASSDRDMSKINM